MEIATKIGSPKERLATLSPGDWTPKQYAENVAANTVKREGKVPPEKRGLLKNLKKALAELVSPE